MNGHWECKKHDYFNADCEGCWMANHLNRTTTKKDFKLVKWVKA